MKRTITITEEYGVWKLETDDAVAVTGASLPGLLAKALPERGVHQVSTDSLSTAAILLNKLFRIRGIGEE